MHEIIKLATHIGIDKVDANNIILNTSKSINRSSLNKYKWSVQGKKVDKQVIAILNHVLGCNYKRFFISILV